VYTNTMLLSRELEIACVVVIIECCLLMEIPTNFQPSVSENTNELLQVESRPLVDAQPLIRKRRNARQRREFVWRTRVVPFEISHRLRRSSALIYDAIKEIETKSCLAFTKHRSSDRNWIKFELGDGCSSSVGKAYWRPGPQTIILDYPCLEKATILHEIMHALGFWHEHSRPDRNKHIEIYWENIDPVNEINFEKFDNFEVDTLGVQYDFKSILHYGNYAFSKNNRRTLQAIGDHSMQLGNSKGLSKLDVVRLNALYDCKSKVSGKRNFMSEWSSWSACDSSCHKQRQRFCMSTKLEKCKRANKHGVETQTEICYAECFTPVDGHWGRWSSWSSCSVTCGMGRRLRSRTCNDPSPMYGGKECQGKSNDMVSCKRRRCNLGPYDCDFDNGMCRWINIKSKDDFRWQLRRGETPSRYTGPRRDHTSGKGQYLYTEASFPAQRGMVARLKSPAIIQFGSLEKCLQLWYNMNGQMIGAVRLLQSDIFTGVEKEIWKASGNKGDKWNEARITVRSRNPFRLTLEAVHPGSYLSDIAIDDIKFTDGACKVDVCEEALPLGLSEGLIEDRNLLATTMKDVAHSPVFARLRNDSAWCTDEKSSSRPHYLRIDLGREVNILSIATQGLKDSWVRRFQLYYKKNTGIWHKIASNGKGIVFEGNSDANSIARNVFPEPVVGRYIGFSPLKWHKSICIRLELYGCRIQ